MMLDSGFYDKLSRLRLAMGQKTSMNLTGNRKSVQKGSSTEFSDFREYMPGDDIRRIDWNAYGRLDRFYVKEYMEEKEAVVTVLLDTSASMNYGEKKKSELACRLAAALGYLGLNNMDRVLIYDMQRMSSPFVATGGKKAIFGLSDWLDKCKFENSVDIMQAVKTLPAKGPGVTIIISDFLQESFLDTKQESARQILRFLKYRRQKPVFLQVLAGEEVNVSMTGTKNLIDMEDKSSLRLTLEASSIRVYEKALQEFMERLQKECVMNGAVYAMCNTNRDLYQMIFQDLRMLYDI